MQGKQLAIMNDTLPPTQTDQGTGATRPARPAQLRKRRQRGAAMIEAVMVFTPLLLMTFLTADLAMVLFLRTTFQEAAREGARYAITGQNTTGPCQDDSIKKVVKNYGLGFLSSTTGSASVHVQFVDPATGGQGSNAPGQIVNVKVENYKYSPLGPFERVTFPVYVSATASDVIEPFPGQSPCLSNSTDK